jgi:predicted RNase H-like HicB family nuclease
MKYHFRTHREGHIYWAECLELESCLSQADTELELLDSMHEALNLYLSEPDSPKTIFSLPKKRAVGGHIAQVSVDPKIAWVILLRNARLSKGWTQRQAANALGMKSIYAYQKLESVKLANPELSTIVKIKAIFPELRLDWVV